MSVSLKMADEEAGGAERMEVSTELPQTPQLLASVSPCRQVPFVPPQSLHTALRRMSGFAPYGGSGEGESYGLIWKEAME